MGKDEIRIGLSVYDLDNLDKGEGVIQGITHGTRDLPYDSYKVLVAYRLYEHASRSIQDAFINYYLHPGKTAIKMDSIDQLIDKETYDKYKRGEIEYVKI